MKKLPIILTCLAVCTAAVLSAAQTLVIPQIQHTVKIDGSIDSSEWAQAPVFSDFLSLNGYPVRGTRSSIRLMADREYLYLAIHTDPGEQTDTATPFLLANAKYHDSDVHNDDAVEVILGPTTEKRLYQIITNSRGVVYDSQIQPVNSPKWNLKGLVIGNRVRVLRWDLEMKIPMAEIGIRPDTPFRLNLCRDWVQHGYSSLTGSGYFDNDRMLTVVISPDAPSFQQQFHQNNHDLQFSFQGKSGLECSVELLSPNHGILQKHRKSLSGEKEIFTTRIDRTFEYNCARLSISEKGRTLLSREFKIRDIASRLLPPTMQELRFQDGSKTALRFYPGYGRVAFETAFAPESRAAQLVLSGQNSKGRKVTKSFTVRNGSADGFLELPSRNPDTWNFTMEARDASGSPLKGMRQTFRFVLRKWEWLDRKTGIDDDFIVPPFTPVRRDGSRISVLLRKHDAGDLGFWKQVSAKGHDLLSRPMQLNARVNGRAVQWKCRPVRIDEERSTRLKLRYSGESGTLRADVQVTYEYDGMAWYHVTMIPKKGHVKVDALELSFGMKNSEAKYIHSLADSIRRNVCGALPEGQGEIWNSLTVSRMQMQNRDIVRDGFIPYLWFGGISRGICFFADSPENYHLLRKNPMIRLYRENGSVNAKISLWGKPVDLSAPQALEFGFMATPVKPKADFNRKITGITYGKLPGAEVLLFPPRPAGFLNDFDHQPRNNCSWELYSALPRQIHHGDFPEAKWQELMKIWEKDLVEYWTPFRKQLKRAYGKYMGRRDPVDYMTGRIIREYTNYYKRARNCDKVIYYSDPRLVHVHTPEYQDFQAEWWCTRKVGYLGAARNFLVPSFIDYMLWSVEQQIRSGVDGIYYDDTFLLPRANAELDRPEAEMGILAMRDLIRRTAVLMCRYKKDPMIMVHYTDALIIPAFSFANLGFTWEMRFNPVDTQIRFPEDYIFTESTGMQTGLTPFIINGIKHWSGFAGTSRWPAFFKHKSKSIISTVMQYDIKLWSNWDIRDDIAYWTLYPMYRFGIGEKDCRLLPYWENQDLLSTGDKYRGALYLRGDRALIFLSNFGSEQPAAVSLDLQKAGIPADAVMTDLLTGKTWPAAGTEKIQVPVHEYTLLHVGRPGTGNALLPEKGRRIINDPMELKVEAGSGSIRRNMFLKGNPWIKRPGFVKNPLTEQSDINIDSRGNMIFTVDNSRGKNIGSMVWTLDLPLNAGGGYDGMQIFLNMKNMLTANPVCFLGTDASGKKAIRYFRSGKYTRKQADGLIIGSDSIMKDIRNISRFYIRVEARPGTIGQMILQDIRLQENSLKAQGKDRTLVLKKDMAWVKRPNFVGQKGRITASKTSVQEEKDGSLVFTVDNTGSASVAGMVWTLDMPVRLNGCHRGIRIDFSEQNLDSNSHFFPMALSCILQDGKTKIRELDLCRGLDQQQVHQFINPGVMEGVGTVRRFFVRVHAAPGTVSRFALKKIIFTNLQ